MQYYFGPGSGNLKDQMPRRLLGVGGCGGCPGCGGGGGVEVSN